MNQTDFFIEMGLSVVISLLRTLSGENKTRFRAVFKKINKLTAGVYKDDAEFKQEWGSVLDS